MPKAMENEARVVELFRNLNLPCRYIEEMLRQHGIHTIGADLDENDGVLLGPKIIVVKRNVCPNRRAFAQLHGFYHLTAGAGNLPL